MSSEEGKKFGEQYGEIYARFLRKMEASGDELTEEEWVKAFYFHMNELLEEGLYDTAYANLEAAKLPQRKSFVRRQVEIAVKTAIILGAADLATRWYRSDKNKERRKKFRQDVLKRTNQTLAQVYDMTHDAFSNLMFKRLVKIGELTGRRRWVTVGGLTSRHRGLNGKITVGIGGFFLFLGRKIRGPRPHNHNPTHWSNCSCYLEYEKVDGTWVKI